MRDKQVLTMNQKISYKLKLLDYKIDAFTFTGLRFVTTSFLFILLLVVRHGYLIAPVVAFSYYFLFAYFILDRPIDKRMNALEEDALSFVPVLLLCMETERSTKKAILNATEIIKNSLSDEFAKVLHDIKCGKSLDESLKDLYDRVPSDSIRNIIVSIREASCMGNSVTSSVSMQIDFLKEKKQKKLLSSYKLIPLQLIVGCVCFSGAMLFVYSLFMIYG